MNSHKMSSAHISSGKTIKFLKFSFKAKFTYINAHSIYENENKNANENRLYLYYKIYCKMLVYDTHVY